MAEKSHKIGLAPKSRDFSGSNISGGNMSIYNSYYGQIVKKVIDPVNNSSHDPKVNNVNVNLLDTFVLVVTLIKRFE